MEEAPQTAVGRMQEGPECCEQKRRPMDNLKGEAERETAHNIALPMMSYSAADRRQKAPGSEATGGRTFKLRSAALRWALG